jgi:hypothetical protein
MMISREMAWEMFASSIRQSGLRCGDDDIDDYNIRYVSLS